MPEGWAPVIVAIITAFGAIIAAWIGRPGSKRPMPLVARGGLIVVGLLIGFGVGWLFTKAWEYEPCLSAKIISPKGAPTNRRNNAVAFPVSSPIAVSWDKTECVMTVEYYQKGRSIEKYKQKTSGEEIYIGAPGSGETEIKLWWEGSKKESNSVWVWVK